MNDTNSEQSEKGISHWLNNVHQGDVRERLAEMPESSVHMSMTSPPYFQLRDYGADGQIGLEESLEEYIDEIVNIGRALRRVLRDDGSWWLNLGDTFGDGKQKQLVPHRVAIALQDDGWIVRNDVTWAKPNPMPESVKDRLTTTTEQVFHLVPDTDYWYDLDSIREPHKDASIERSQREDNRHEHSRRQSVLNEETLDPERFVHPSGKNPGDVFEVTAKPFPDAHFAVYPPELCETPIKATAPPKVCSECAAPYDRITEDVPMWERDPDTIDRSQTKRALEIADEEGLTEEHFKAARSVGIGNLDGGEGNPYDRVDDDTERLAREAADALGSYYREALMSETAPTDNWRKTCDCETEDTEPGIVLDPFAGSGTTCLVAKRLGRRFVGIELNPDYVAMAQKRIGITVDDPDRLLEKGETSLTQFAEVSD